MKITIFILYLIFIESFASKILLLAPVGSKSHHIFYRGIVQSLANRGHEVVAITPFHMYGNLPNVEEIKISTGELSNAAKNAFEINTFKLLKVLSTKIPKLCFDSTSEKGVQEALGRDYDLILLPHAMARCYLPYVYKKKIPFILVYFNTVHGSLSTVMGGIDLPSIVSPLYVPLPYPLNFFSRCASALVTFFEGLFNIYVTHRRIEQTLREKELFGYSLDMPTLMEMEKRASLAFVNNVRALENPPRPHPPNIIHVGGIHIHPSNKLTKDLNQWLNDSGDDGFILFSLGSLARSSDMKMEHLMTFINVFKTLKQRILWKCENTIEDIVLPSNVKMIKWVPQQDVLAHPKIKLFLSHGGLLSAQEAWYFGVPIVGMPIFGDQFHNMLKMSAEGVGLRLDWKDLSEESLEKAIFTGINNSSLKNTMALRAKLMKDAPLSPSEDVVYWTEYVIRYGGAQHLKPPLGDLQWYEIYNIDIWLFVISILMSFCFALVFIFKNVKRCFIKQKMD